MLCGNSTLCIIQNVLTCNVLTCSSEKEENVRPTDQNKVIDTNSIKNIAFNFEKPQNLNAQVTPQRPSCDLRVSALPPLPLSSPLAQNDASAVSATDALSCLP